MSTLENPSKQLSFVLDALNDYTTGRLDVLGPKLAEVSDLRTRPPDVSLTTETK